MTNISQTQAGFKSKSLGILCGFQGFLTQNPAALVETDDIFDVSDTPYGFSGLNTLRAAGVPNPPAAFCAAVHCLFLQPNRCGKPEQKRIYFVIS